jgi:predicted RNA-binding protein YlxR (DUF448 family)
MLKGYRKCICCGSFLPKEQMLRIVRTKVGDVLIDFDNKIYGRGCYICFSCTDISKFKKRNIIAKSLKTNVDIKFYNEIEEYLKNLSI